MNAERLSASGRAAVLLFTMLGAVRAQAQTTPPSPAPTPAPAAPAGATAAESLKVTPYGIVFFNGFGNSGASNNADVPLWATGGPGSVSASGRQSRFGLRVTGVTAAGGKLSGVVETDFFGGFPAIGIGDNMGVVRLRLANAKIDWEQTTLLVGQEWMVFAPGNPVSLAAAGIPLEAASGNPWARLPQVRLERRFGAGAVQGAVLAPSTGDFTSAFLYQPAAGALSEQPFLQARASLASKKWRDTGKPASLGVSGHYGKAKMLGTAGAPDRELESAAGAVDWSLPLVSRVGLAGEAFVGQNLAGFQAGVFQGVNPDFGITGPIGLVLDGPRSIGTRGLWTQLAVTAMPDKLTFYGTYGIDDPDDADLVSVAKRDWRLRNWSFALSFIHKVSAPFSWGVEVRRAETRFLQTGDKKNTHVNLGATLTF
jgi:hypothetical protein